MLQKTAGVSGDDLTLNAEQVSGVKAERELPAVWAVAKGFFLNKLILVPSVLLISMYLPWLIVVLLVIGGLYICSRVSKRKPANFLHYKDEMDKEHVQKIAAAANINVDLVALEKTKNKSSDKN